MSFNQFMHPWNTYRNRPDYSELAKKYSEFGENVLYNDHGGVYGRGRCLNIKQCFAGKISKKFETSMKERKPSQMGGPTTHKILLNSQICAVYQIGMCFSHG